MPSWKVAFLAILKKFHELGVDEVNGHLLYGLSDDAYARAEAWLEHIGVFGFMEDLLAAHRDDRVLPVETILDQAVNRFADLWEAEAGLKTYGRGGGRRDVVPHRARARSSTSRSRSGSSGRARASLAARPASRRRPWAST